MAANVNIRAGLAACTLLACCGWCNVAVAGHFDKYPHETVTDPARIYLPAKYYERVAIQDVRGKDYAGALNAYTRAAYWGNKVAQYDIGEIYLHGAGRIAADPARGVAWLGIADEVHDPDYDRALVEAYKALKPADRKRAQALWTELQATYADKLTLARATRAFEGAYHSARAASATTENDPNAYSIAIDGYDPAGNVQDEAALVSELNALGVQNGVTSEAGLWSARKKEFASFVTAQFGHVSIGPLEQIAPATGHAKH